MKHPLQGDNKMNREVCHLRFHEALSKAFAARASNVRAAYFDLANFYRQQLGDRAHICPSSEDLHRCLAVINPQT